MHKCKKIEPKQLYNCMYCKDTFEHKSEIEQHIKTHQPDIIRREKKHLQIFET